jgi:signal transduction histidine kinase
VTSSAARKLFSVALIMGVWTSIYLLLWFLHMRAPTAGLVHADYQPAISTLQAEAASNGWRKVQLPHVWDWPQANAKERGWYRIDFELPVVAPEPYAILLMQVSMGANLWLNGKPLTDDVRRTGSTGRNWFHPLLYEVPEGLLRQGNNQLTILARATSPGKGFLGKVYVDTTARLWPAYEARYFMKATLLHLSVVFLLAISAPMALLAYWRRDDDAYFWFAVAGLLFAGTISVMSLAALPMSSLVHDWIWTALLSSFMLVIMVTVHRLLDIRRSWTRYIIGGAVLGNLVLALIAAHDEMLFHVLADRIWIPATILSGLYPAWLMMRKYWNEPRSSLFWLMISGTLLMVTGARDWLALGWWISPVDGLYTFMISPVLFVTFFVMLLEQFHESRKEAESLNRELNARVIKKQAELERTYEELRRSEEQRLLADERERIQRDMHDGLGGTLVSTLAGLEMEGAKDSGAAQSLRSALDDLRLMIYSLDQNSGTLRSAMGMLRERIERLGEDAAMEIEWDMQALPTELSLERGATLQLMRIVQEAFTNCVKHASAKSFSLSVGALAKNGAAGVQVVMRDTGRGFDPDRIKSAGYGLSNMRVRAQKIGGQLDFGVAEPGTRITLWVPSG